MAESETGLSDLMEDFDLEDVGETGYEKVLGCRLPFIWFVRNGSTVVKYFESHREVAQPWTHELDCACGSCDFTTAVA